MDAEEYLADLFAQALSECSPNQAVQKNLHLTNKMLEVGQQKLDIEDTSIYVFAVGKASLPMLKGAQMVLGERIEVSLAITSDTSEASSGQADEIIVGSHPVPDEGSLKAGQKAADFYEQIPDGALVINLISGGASSLMTLPAEGILMSELNETFELLINSGADIHEINAVRKHCSQIKGGQLLRHLSEKVSMINLFISDVPGNDLSSIGSGPITPDATTFEDAISILRKHDCWNALHASVQNHLQRGRAGEVEETLRPKEFQCVQSCDLIVSSITQVVRKISDLALEDDLNSWVADESFSADAQEVVHDITSRILPYAERVAVLEELYPLLFIYYGECTLHVESDGKGGRNQHMVLLAAREIQGYDNVTWLSAGTDGIDGPTDAAGAYVNGNTIERAKKEGVDADEYLQNHDSYHFHEQMNTLLKTGPTGNNLMDVTMVYVH